VALTASLSTTPGISLAGLDTFVVSRTTEFVASLAAPPSLAPGLGVRGVLPAQALWAARADEWFTGKFTVPPENIQPASLDLRLGEHAYALNCSFLPDTRTSVADKLESAKLVQGEPIDLTKGHVLERDRPYLIPLMEELRLPDFVSGRTNPKSSTGRLDIFTRVITDRNPRFDEIANGYTGKLYLEVVPRSFSIRVETGLCLNQLRLSIGDATPELTIYDIHQQSPLLFDTGPLDADRLPVDDGLFMSVGLRDEVPGYRAKKTSPLLDLSRIGYYEVDDFWEPIRVDRDGRSVLEPDDFYLLISDERVIVPPDLACEMAPYDATAGELRTHYAGFFDPGFGYDPEGVVQGARAVLEVRARDVPFMIEHGQRICKLTFERMLEPPLQLYGEEIGSSYQYQEITLSKHFKQHRDRPERQLTLAFPAPGAWDQYLASKAASST
jgi:dCTP deaminase